MEGIKLGNLYTGYLVKTLYNGYGCYFDFLVLWSGDNMFGFSAKLVTNGKNYYDPSLSELEKLCQYGIYWQDSMIDYRLERVISPYCWQVVNRDGIRYLKDRNGEVRTVEWGAYHSAVEYQNWQMFDERVKV